MFSQSWLLHVPVTGPTPHILARLCPGGWREPQRPWSRGSSREETGHLPSAGSCRNSAQTDPQLGKCKIPGETGQELGETAGRGGETLITGNISPGEAGGEMSHHLQRERQPERRPGGWGRTSVQAAGSPPGPWSRPRGVRRVWRQDRSNGRAWRWAKDFEYDTAFTPAVPAHRV